MHYCPAAGVIPHRFGESVSGLAFLEWLHIPWGPAALNTTRTLVDPFADDAPIGRRPLVAVLPFATLGGDASLQGLGAEIADLLRERLESDPALQAILISSEFLSKAPPHAIELICRELRVGYLITGKCHAVGGNPSLYVEVTDTRDWHIRWANFYGGRARALLADEDGAMGELAASLRRLLIEQPAR